MEKNTAIHHETYEIMNAATELRLHMEALRALFLLMENTYFKPRAECFVDFLTVQQWEQIQLNVYNLTGIVDSVMKECRTVEALMERLYEQSMEAQ